MQMHTMADDGLNKREDVLGKDDARRKLHVYQKVGYRGLTAEVIDDDGEVVAYFERGQWTEAAR